VEVKRLGFGSLLLGIALMTGCNGGSSCCSSTSKATAKERVVATMRITRATFAVAGFARRVARSPSPGMGNRIGVWLAAIRSHRDASPLPPTPSPPVLDKDTNLYYTLTVNSDGSGRQDLFVDSAAKKAAGAFTWTAPQWTNGATGTYPATFETVYQITAGNFAGEHGTIDITADDATGNNGEMKIDLTDAEGEHCLSDFTIANGVISAKAHCTLADDTSYDESYYTDPNDVVVCTTTFPDGGTEDVTLNPDGSATETVDDSSGQTQATGDVQSDGQDTIQYDDGSSDTVNVDTNTDTSSSDSSDSSGDGRASKRAANNRLSGKPPTSGSQTAPAARSTRSVTPVQRSLQR